MYELDLEKSEKPESKLPASLGTQKKQGSSRRTFYFCFSDYAKSLCVDLSDPGIKPESPASPALAGIFFTLVPPIKLLIINCGKF